MTRTQMAIFPGMVTAFGLGKAGDFFGVNAEFPLLFLLFLVAVNVYFENKELSVQSD